MKSKIINNSMAGGAGGLPGNSSVSGGSTGNSGQNGGTTTNQSKELPNIQTRSLVAGGSHLPPANGNQPGGGNINSISGVGSG